MHKKVPIIMTSSYKWIFVLAFFALTSTLKATHIVGGEISFECLGNDQYRISLEVYRDCYYGNPLAYFDDPAYVGIFNEQNLLVEVIEMPFTGLDDTLSAIFNDPCLFDPGDVCVHTTHYEKIISLPPIPGGYQFVYQRCCRNATISNIQNPLESGMTILTYMSEQSMLECNNGPDFAFIPPIFICVNKPINFDHSATDTEGDSLAYKLCTPYLGASYDAPQPDTPSTPPYDTVQWVYPLYSLDNLLGTDSTVLTIDPQTGLLTGFPTNQGQFVVSVCVEEYRNGQLISSMRRDFQYNVGVCGEVTAAFFSPEAQCDQLTVEFTNQSSVYASEYLWYFQYPDTTAFSTSENPTHTYPDTGSYQIMLIADPNSVCADTFISSIYLQNNSLFADYELEIFNCGDSTVLSLFDQSYDTISAPESWTWMVNYDTVTLTSTQQNPQFLLPPNVNGTVNMQVRSINGCEQNISFPFDTGQDLPGQIIPDTAYACLGQEAYLNPLFDQIHSSGYFWQPTQLVSDSLAPNPYAIADSIRLFTVEIQAPDSLCTFVKQVTLLPLPYPELTSPDSILLCPGESVVLNPNGNPNYHYSWTSSGQPLSNPNATSPEVSPSTTTLYTVEIIAPGPDTCIATRQVLVHVPPPIGLQPIPDTVTCEPSITINAQTDEFTTIFWFENGQPILPPSQELNVQVSGLNTYMLNAVDIYGCVAMDTFTISGGPVEINLTPNIAEVCTNEPVQIQTDNLDPNDQLIYNWTVSGNGSLSANDIPNPIYTANQAGTEWVIGSFTNQYNCSIQDSILITSVDGGALLDFTYEVLCDGLTVQFYNLSTNVDSFYWDFGLPNTNTDTSTAINPIFTFPDLGSYQVSLSIPYSVDCAFPVSMTVDITNPILQANFDYAYSACEEDSILISFFDQTLNTLTSPVTNWQWTFSNGQSSNQQNPSIYVYPGDAPLIAQLQVTTSINCVSTTTDTLTFNFLEVFLPDTLVLCLGDTTQLNPGANPNYDYLWSPTTGLSDPTSGSPLAFPSETTTYTLNITNYDGTDTCQIQKNITIFVPDDIQLDLGPQDTLITCNNPVFIQATANQNIDYQWFNQDSIIIGTDSSITVLPDSIATYALLASNIHNCTAAAQITVINGTLDIQAEDELFICPTDSLQLSLNNIDSFDQISVSWIAGTGGSLLSDSTTPNPWVSTQADLAIFYYTVSNQFDCTLQDSLLVHTSNFQATVNDSLFACYAEPTFLNPTGNPAYNYLWTPNTGLDDPTSYNPLATLTQDQIYTVILSNDDGISFCSDTLQVHVYVSPDLALQISANQDTLLCAYDSVLLQANTAVPASFVWYQELPWIIPIGQEDTISVLPQGSTTYYLLATDSLGCSDTAAISFQAYPLNIDIPAGLTACAGEKITLTIPNNAPDQELLFEWLPDSLVEIIDSNTISLTLYEDINLEVTITNQIGCTAIATIPIEVTDLQAMAFAEAEPDTIFPANGQTSQLNTLNLPGLSYYWTPQFSLSNPNIFNPIATPQETTTYTVIVQDDNGCQAQAEVKVVVLTPECREPVIFVPSAFSPNGDGHNDLLRVRGNELADNFFIDFYFVIYNRWGQRLFETTDPNQAWDGSFKGVPLEPDVFGYYLEVKCYNGETFFKKGNVTLLR